MGLRPCPGSKDRDASDAEPLRIPAPTLPPASGSGPAAPRPRGPGRRGGPPRQRRGSEPRVCRHTTASTCACPAAGTSGRAPRRRRARPALGPGAALGAQRRASRPRSTVTAGPWDPGAGPRRSSAGDVTGMGGHGARGGRGACGGCRSRRRRRGRGRLRARPSRPRPPPGPPPGSLSAPGAPRRRGGA